MRSGHGGDIYRNKVLYDFSVNVNPFGMPESCKRAVVDSLSMVSCYPDCIMSVLREKLAVKELGEGAKAENVTLGNGASELIYALCQALRPEVTLVTAPAFKEYEAAAEIAGGRVLYEQLLPEQDFALTDHILEAITTETDLLFLCNPNNPTGQTMSKDLLIRIAERCEETDTFFCLDECFLPFMEEEEVFTMRDRMDGFPHLMILKAFTKIFGMAGLRFGYLLSANEGLLEEIRGVIQPWNVSVPAQAAAMAALEEDAYIQKTKKLITAEREFLLGSLRGMKVDVIGKPAANFIFFRGSSDLAEKLLAKGVLIRSCSNYTSLDEGYYRIGVRSPEENRAFVDIIRSIL